MSALISAFALFVSMVAIWLVSESNKRISDNNSAFIKAHVKSLKGDLGELKRVHGRTVERLLARISALEDDFLLFKADNKAASDALSDILKNNRAKKNRPEPPLPENFAKRGAA